MPRFLLIILSLACVGLAGCTSAPVREVTPTHILATAVQTAVPDSFQPTIQPTATTQLPTTTPSPESTPTATVAAPTQTPLPTSTSVACLPPPRLPAEANDLPDLANLRWEMLTIADQTVRHFTSATFHLIPVGLTQDGRWLATAFQGAESRAAVAMIDTQANEHWWVNTDTYFDLAVDAPFDTWKQWLARDRLVWLDETGGQQVLVSEGETFRLLEAPVPLYGVRYASNNIAFAQAGEGALWRVNLISNQWEEVTTSQPPIVGSLGGYYSIAEDGTYAFSFQGGQHGAQMWRILAEMGAIAEPLPDIEMPLNIIGSGAPLPMPRQLANSSYWLITLPLVLEGSMENIQEAITASGIVVDTRDGHVLSAEDLGFSDEYYLTRFSLSPDSKWLSIELTDRESHQVVGLYLTAVDDLTSGRLIDSSDLSVVGWHPDSLVAIFRNEATEMFSVAPLPLIDGSPGVPLEGAGKWLAVLSGSIITTAANDPAHVLQFDLEGNLLNTLDLSSQYESVQVIQGTAARTYLGTVGHQSQENNTCTYGLVEWTFDLGS